MPAWRAGLPLAVAMAAALGLVAGCAGSARREATGFYVDDAAITSRIRSELVADRNVDLGAIAVATVNGNVTLSGRAETLLQKQTAQSTAMKIRGVKQVRNEIALRP